MKDCARKISSTQTFLKIIGREKSIKLRYKRKKSIKYWRISAFSLWTHSFNFKLERFCMCPKFHLIFYMLSFIQNNIWWVKVQQRKYFTEARMNTDLTHSLILTSIDFTTVHLRWHVCVWHKSFHIVHSLVTKDSLGSFHDSNLMIQS